jgi:hypothetical protein
VSGPSNGTRVAIEHCFLEDFGKNLIFGFGHLEG